MTRIRWAEKHADGDFLRERGPLVLQRRMSTVQEACVKGLSTRKVDDLIQALGMSGISKSQVSRLRAELDERAEAFPNRAMGRVSGPQEDQSQARS